MPARFDQHQPVGRNFGFENPGELERAIWLDRFGASSRIIVNEHGVLPTVALGFEGIYNDCGDRTRHIYFTDDDGLADMMARLVGWYREYEPESVVLEKIREALG